MFSYPIKTYCCNVEPGLGLLCEVFPEVDHIASDDPGEAGKEPDPGDAPPAAPDCHGEAGDEEEEGEDGGDEEVRLDVGDTELSSRPGSKNQSEE